MAQSKNKQQDAYDPNPYSQPAFKQAQTIQLKNKTKKDDEKIFNAFYEANDQAQHDLPDQVKTKMENSFGTDFSDVKIHKDSSSADELGAKAYAKGKDIHFAPGEFQPNTKSGQELLGHELTHVVQQQQGMVTSGSVNGKDLVNSDPALEQEADEKGKEASNGKSVQINGVGNGIQRTLNFAAIAKKIHDAIDGMGTDESAVYEALRLLKRDEKNILYLKLKYKELYKTNLVDDIQDDFSGEELDEAMSFLRAYYTPEQLGQTNGSGVNSANGEARDKAIEHTSSGTGKALEKKGQSTLNKMSSEGYMKTNTGKLVKTSRFKKVTTETGEVVQKPVNFGWKQGDQVHTTKGIDLHTGKTSAMKGVGSLLQFAGEFMDLISLANILMGKDPLYKGVDIIFPASIVNDPIFEAIDQAHIKACLQQGYGATKTMVENSRTFPGRLVYCSEAEIVKLHQKQITSISGFANPMNQSQDFALLISKGKEFSVYGGFYIGK